jgi:hypothetical protein
MLTIGWTCNLIQMRDSNAQSKNGERGEIPGALKYEESRRHSL